MLSHRALLSHLHSIASFKIIDGDSVVLAMLPLFHVFGLNAVLGSWAASGARLVIMDGLDGFAEVLTQEHVTNVPLAPRCLRESWMTRRPLPAWVRKPSCRVPAPLPVDLREQFTARTGLRVEQGYGLTEAAPGSRRLSAGNCSGTVTSVDRCPASR